MDSTKRVRSQPLDWHGFRERHPVTVKTSATTALSAHIKNCLSDLKTYLALVCGFHGSHCGNIVCVRSHLQRRKIDLTRNSSKRIQRPTRGGPIAKPIRWEELPHHEIWSAAVESTSPGSWIRAREDAKLHVLKLRLPRLDPADHFNYVEIECGRMVELLRAIRDEYRRRLRLSGAKPLAETYWVILRYGVKDWAVMVLREAISRYIRSCEIPAKQWDTLFGIHPLLQAPEWTIRNRMTPFMTGPPFEASINGLIRKDVFEIGWARIGGPFSRDAQERLGRNNIGAGLLMGLNLAETIKQRQQFWDDCQPWTEGLAMLFDAVHGELLFQVEALGDDWRRLEAKLAQLTDLQRIAHDHLHSMSVGSSSRKFGEVQWLDLLGRLDEKGISVGDSLSGRAKRVLMAVRKKGIKIETWVDCYTAKAWATFEDDKRYSLRREVAHAVHNAADAASAKLGNVWNLHSAKSNDGE